MDVHVFFNKFEVVEWGPFFVLGHLTWNDSLPTQFRLPRNPHGVSRRELGTPAVGGERLTALRPGAAQCINE